MPSRQLSQSPLTSAPPYADHRLLAPLSGGVTAAFSLLSIFTACFPKLRKRTVPFDSSKLPPRRFSYSYLFRATSSFSPSHRLGQGGFGSVYRGILTDPLQQVAVKVMDGVGSMQGEREFKNELSIAGKCDSDHIVSLIGFSADKKCLRMILVYELMGNGSLQDCLLHRKCPELIEWKKRFTIATDIAKGLEYLHHYCNPSVIHGDIKPGNILLDYNFNAKIGDFGLARLKSDNHCQIAIVNGGAGEEESSYTLKETKSTATGTAEFNEFNVGINQSPESFIRVTIPNTMVAGVCMTSSIRGFERSGVLSEGDLDMACVGSEAVMKNGGFVNDYVTEWIKNRINKEMPKNEWIGASSRSIGKSIRRKNRKGLDWWKTMDEEKNEKKEKTRLAREWWKEEYCEELTRNKNKKKKKQGSVSDCNDVENWWPVEDDLYIDRKKKNKKNSRSRGVSMGSVDWFNGNSHDSGTLKSSGGFSSTPSMRGTVCYNAPENCGGSETSEKCDVYSFGVVLLVLVSGRRPLRFPCSPVTEFQPANLLSWAKQLARRGKLLDLVDKSVVSLDREQAMLCITIALLCLQKMPSSRPCMKEVVGMLCGELECPQLPSEFSQPPRYHLPFKSANKVR